MQTRDYSLVWMPIGKFKNRPIRDLPLDYCLWALSQRWMREQYPSCARGFAVVIRKHFANGDPYDPSDLI